eukprot:TRINITY_DN2012_c0_g2_i6.p1 TRINITY_DN2012_c0_g2~~TRINITY_DN2012_c0_g2_i6.p1  ORF type:complete len:264 (+),score=114.03 TRINITY_DN2012_c0_g2_i6:91-792(+)
MGKRHNNAIPRVHFHKHWNPCSSQVGHIKTYFQQAKQKKARRIRRAAKAARVFPRPAGGALRPAVMACTARYSMKQRKGKGFTLSELKAAGLCAPYARTIGISVDHRRKNKSDESLQRNALRLKEYLAKLVLFPLAGKRKDPCLSCGPVPAAGKAELEGAKQHMGRHGPQGFRAGPVHEAPRELTKEEQTRHIYNYLRAQNRSEKLIGCRLRRAARKAAKAKDDGTAVQKKKK